MQLRISVITKAAITTIIPVLESTPAVESVMTTTMKINQAMSSHSPPNADKQPQTMVDWKVHFEIKLTLPRINRLIVTGIGTTFEEIWLLVPFVLLVLFELLLLLMQKLLFSIRGGVQFETHLLA